MTHSVFGGSGAAQHDPQIAGPRGQALTSESLRLQAAQFILAGRRLRHAHLSGSLFGEPGWDMLLDIYVWEGSGLSFTVAELQTAQEQPASTTMRWLKFLEEQGFVRRSQRPTGAEVVELTKKSRAALDAYLTALQDL